jgi:hypothetical protein
VTGTSISKPDWRFESAPQSAQYAGGVWRLGRSLRLSWRRGELEISRTPRSSVTEMKFSSWTMTGFLGPDCVSDEAPVIREPAATRDLGSLDQADGLFITDELRPHHHPRHQEVERTERNRIDATEMTNFIREALNEPDNRRRARSSRSDRVPCRKHHQRQRSSAAARANSGSGGFSTN